MGFQVNQATQRLWFWLKKIAKQDLSLTDTLTLSQHWKKSEKNLTIRKFLKEKSSNPAIKKKIFSFQFKGIVRWDFRSIQPKTEYRGSPDHDFRTNKLYMILIVSFWLKGITIKIEFHINQVLRRLVSEVQFCLSIQNLIYKALNQFLSHKYCKDRASVVTYFWVPTQKREKIQKKIKTIYSEENKK